MDQLFHKIVNLTSGGGIIALAVVAIFWKLAFPMFTIMFFYALWWVFNLKIIKFMPFFYQQFTKLHIPKW